MNIIYVTLNNAEEARKIGRELLDKNLANCVNFFPITCIYKWQKEVTEEPETVLIIKTKKEKFKEIEKVIKNNIDYTDFIGMINVEDVNNEFREWIDDIVK